MTIERDTILEEFEDAEERWLGSVDASRTRHSARLLRSGTRKADLVRAHGRKRGFWKVRAKSPITLASKVEP